MMEFTMSNISTLRAVQLGAALALFVVFGAGAPAFARKPIPSGPVQPLLAEVVQSKGIYQRLLDIAAAPLKVGEHWLPMTLDTQESRPYSPNGGPGLVSGVFAMAPDVTGKVVYLVFQKPGEADTFMTPPTDPKASAHAYTLRAQLPDGLMRSFSIGDTHNRFSGRLSCYLVRQAAKPMVMALCAYHPAGSVVVANVIIPEAIKSPVSPDYVGSTETRNLTVNLAGAVATQLSQFTSSRQGGDER